MAKRALIAAASVAYLAASEEPVCTDASCASADDADSPALLQLRTSQAGSLKTDDGLPTQEAIDSAMAAFLSMPQEELQSVEAPCGKGPLVLDVEVGELPTPWIGGSYQVRAYNGKLPGPVIRVKPGETVKVQLNNKLGGDGPDMEACAEFTGGFPSNHPEAICRANVTNLHTHGLHVSPEGNADNVFARVLPGDEYLVEVPVPEFHMGGTMWYHAHVHHSTALQAGGGLHGLLIVEDPPHSLPKMVEAMPEKLLMIACFNLLTLMKLEEYSWTNGSAPLGDQQLWKNSAYPNWRFSNTPAGLRVPVWVGVNGQFRPKISIEEGKWTRLRMAYASVWEHVAFWLENGTDVTCSMKLLAKDGVYLHEAGRPVDKIFLGSGNRADVAVKCTCSGPGGCARKMEFEAMNQLLPGQVPEYGEFATLQVLPKRPCFWDGDLEPFTVRRPCYLADLRQATIPVGNNHSGGFFQRPFQFPPQDAFMVMNWDGPQPNWGHGTHPGPMGELPVGSLQEWDLDHIDGHNFHVHVNHFQIMDIVSDDPWNKVGDWHDVMYSNYTQHTLVRSNLDYFTGRVVMHCHILEHEDTGMMGFVNITGAEGTRNAAVKALDPTCYEGRFPDKHYWQEARKPWWKRWIKK